MLADLLYELEAAGVFVELEGDRLAVPAGMLTDELRQRIRAHRDELFAWLSGAADAAAPEPEPDFWTAHPDWRELAAIYYSHHFGCMQCIAAGKVGGERCETGRPLWACYQEVCA